MMMKKFVPVTKLIGTFAFSFWALVMHTPLPLVGLVVLELILLGMCGSLSRNVKAVFSLIIFAVFLRSYSSSAADRWNRLTSRAFACWP